MKKNILLFALAAVTFAGCASSSGLGTALQMAAAAHNQQSTAANAQPATSQKQTSGSTLGSLLGSSNGSQGLLGSLVSGLLGNVIPLSAQSISGTWTYNSPECRFESENFLAQAGGEVAASTVESKMATAFDKIGIRQGACSFTFNDNGTCAVMVGGRTINGTYTIDPNTRQLNIKSSTGLLSLNTTAYLSLGTLTLLFDAQKLLSLVQGVGALTGNLNSTVGTVSSLLNNYKGMKIGMNLTK